MNLTPENARIFFVNKFKWLDAAPMATISTFFTYALAELGYDTTLIIQGDPNTDTGLVLTEKFGLTPLKNYHAKLFSRFKSSFIQTSSNFYWKATRYILANRQTNGPIIVISRNTNFLPYMVMLKKAFNMTAVFETHGYHGFLTLPGFPPPPHRPYLKLSYQFQQLERVFMNHLDGLVCITSPQEKLYQNDFVKIPTTFLPLGAPPNINTERSLDPQKSFQYKKLCYIGRLNQHIDYRMILKAIKLLKDETIKFVWIGLKPENFLTLENEVKKQQLEDRVELKGWMNHSEMRQYLANHVSAGLVAYKPTYQSMVFTAPSKILDYFASGLPVIAPQLPNVEDIIVEGKNGLLYRPEDSESLASTVEFLFRDYDVFQQLKSASLESAQKYSWKNRARKFMSFAESLA